MDWTEEMEKKLSAFDDIVNGEMYKTIARKVMEALEYARYDIVNAFWSIYDELYSNIIYEFYSSREPVYYTRHGEPSGFNLYSAFESHSSGSFVSWSIDSSKLLAYNTSRKYSSQEIKDYVLRLVLNYDSPASRPWRGLYPAKRTSRGKLKPWGEPWNMSPKTASGQDIFFRSTAQTPIEVLFEVEDFWRENNRLFLEEKAMYYLGIK